ncbi:short chain dehydrogenase [Xylariomycetidae sp. FL0641]|nr:short chain dehydrogenase [Xylariomycetidae sp. FL0641]
MPWPYKTVLMVGCTSGIGVALAEKMMEAGSFVVAVGRRRDRLDAFVARHGADRAAASAFDITDLGGMAAWADGITKTHPTLDAVVLNAGIQRALDFTDPGALDLGLVDAEITTNYTAYVHLLKHLLPHLQALSPRPAAVVAVSSGLALVPIPRCAGYCATKSALHSLLWSLRAQLAHHAPSAHIRVAEILPPAVRTELHALQPDLAAQGDTDFGLSLDAFLADAWAGLVEGGREDIPVGPVKARWEALEKERKKAFEDVAEQMLGKGMAYSSGSK